MLHLEQAVSPPHPIAPSPQRTNTNACPSMRRCSHSIPESLDELSLHLNQHPRSRFSTYVRRTPCRSAAGAPPVRCPDSTRSHCGDPDCCNGLFDGARTENGRFSNRRRSPILSTVGLLFDSKMKSISAMKLSSTWHTLRKVYEMLSSLARELVGARSAIGHLAGAIWRRKNGA